MQELGRNLVVPDPVLLEVDQLVRARGGMPSARSFLRAAVVGDYTVAYLTPELLRRAAEFDTAFADLDLGLVDGVVMAYAERHRLPVLTFDFAHFRATRPAHGFWRLVIDESRYAEASRAGS